MKKGWVGGSCKRQNISLPRFYSYTFCFRNAETFCGALKCFAFSFQNNLFYLKIKLFLNGERKTQRFSADRMK